MMQLRWTLLILGALFLGGLALWESLRGRRARQADLGRLAGADPAARDRELRDRDLQLPDAALPSFSARDPERERADGLLPVYELPQSQAPEPGRRLDPILDFEGDAPVADESGPVITEPVLDETPLASPAPAPAHTVVHDDTPAAAQAQPDAPPVVVAPVTEPIVEWPDPQHSQVLSVRILAPREKFQGRAVRLALTAQGFLPGRFSIYHKPARDGRALLSVASLTKPGTFDDPPRGDMQRFSGLNLFTVLPGPLPPGDAVEELLHVAGVLAARLQARLTDDQGEPLSAARAQELRDMAVAQPS